jgi:hypothetical protein
MTHCSSPGRQRCRQGWDDQRSTFQDRHGFFQMLLALRLANLEVVDAVP